MSWATRLTLILAILWGLFCLFIGLAAGQHAGLRSDENWVFGFYLMFFGVPLGVIWVLLRLILGDRGALRRG